MGLAAKSFAVKECDATMSFEVPSAGLRKTIPKLRLYLEATG